MLGGGGEKQKAVLMPQIEWLIRLQNQRRWPVLEEMLKRWVARDHGPFKELHISKK